MYIRIYLSKFLGHVGWVIIGINKQFLILRHYHILKWFNNNEIIFTIFSELKKNN